MPTSAQFLHEVLGPFLISLPEIELVRPLSAAIAVKLNAVTAAACSQLHTILLKLVPDAFSSGFLINAEVADAGDGASERKLRDEVNGDEAQNSAVFNRDYKFCICVDQKLGDIFLDEMICTRIT
jgi:hypothetical protein